MLQNLFRSYFARFMYPLAQVFVLNSTLRGGLFCLPFWLYDIWLTWKVRFNFFFWDTIQLGSKHAHYFYETSFESLLLPDSIDSGHPPFFGIYIALMWTMFGKTLIVSHLSMFPFLLGITWQSLKLGEKILGEWQAPLFVLMLKINPIMAGQSVIISPDIILVFFFLMALNAIFSEKSWLLSVAVIGLSLISMRGMMTAAMLFVYQIFRTKNGIIKQPTKLLSMLTPYWAGGFCALSFLAYHYWQKGWIGYHAGSEWAEAFQIVDTQGCIKNCLVFIWRLLDNGHLFLWLSIIYTLYYNRSLQDFKNTRSLITLLIISIIVLSPTLIIYKGLLQHRYLLPIYLIINILALKTISDIKSSPRQTGLYLLIYAGLICGHFWIYPQPIATSWDTTLSHLPYYKLRNDMMQYIDNQHIDYRDIGTAYPNLSQFKYIDLTDRSGSFAPLDFSKNKYIFYSNVMNDFNREELTELQKNWIPLKRLDAFPSFSSGKSASVSDFTGQVFVILYKKVTIEE